MVREFKLVNEKGEQYSLMDIQNYCLITDPAGLGYSYSTTYEQVGNTFISSLRKLEQGQISGIVNFINYDNYRNLVNFIERSKKLQFLYKIPIKSNEIVEYYKDVNIQGLTKTQKQTNGIISETITFDCLSLWYEQKEIIYTIEADEEEFRWDFTWDVRFIDYANRVINFINEGHVDAAIEAELDGRLINPSIIASINNKAYAELNLTVVIGENEKLLYSSKQDNLYIMREKTNQTLENLFKKAYIDVNKQNIFRLPKGNSEITLKAENEVLNAKLKIYVYYKVV